MAYVVNGNNVSVINTKTNTITDTVPVGANPGRIAVTPDGTKVYVVNQGTFDIRDNSVSIIDTKTNTVADKVNVGVNPTVIAIAPDGTKVYVAKTGTYDIPVTLCL